jgi:GT2 family glycosyltransferase
MSVPLSTVVAVPRERFESAVESLESLFANTAQPFALVYVDAGSPRAVAERIAVLARQKDFTLIRCDRYLTPNQARNLALPHVKTRYAAFVDNDVFFAPGWLAALERCAEDTAADIVAPVICIGRPAHSKIHHAGGMSRIIEEGGRRVFKEKHNLAEIPLAGVREALVRAPTEMCEFHCVLVRTSVFERLGRLDENLMSSHEHIDLCLKVREGGGSIFFEPESVVTYIPKKLRPYEIPYFMLRWSTRWTRHSLDHFFGKWNAVEFDDGHHEIQFVRRHRGHALPKLRQQALAAGGWRLGNLAIDIVEGALAAIARRRFVGIGRPIPASVVHEAATHTQRAA